jgi:hypothetical protein
MPKGFTILGMVTSILILLLFSADLAVKFPFNRQVTLDVVFIICALILGYLSWSTMRELS